MHNKLFATIAISGLVISIAACGSKDKKTPEAPTSADTTEVEGDPSATADNAAGDSAAASPASLGELIYFEFDSNVLSDEARGVLDGNAAWLRENAARTLQIEGHTDEVGTTEYNLGLGDRRARAARDYLVRLGIEEARVTLITFGEERPQSDADSENRRSVFVATKK